MAIIKCPECGHMISDKAPTCPSCGVEIAGKVVKCTECGQEYFKEEGECPHCHHQYSDSTGTPQAEPDMLAAAPITPADTSETGTQNMENADNTTVATARPAEKPGAAVTTPPSTPATGQKEKKNNRTVIIVSVVIALLICGVVGYLYKDAQQGREQDDYEYAMTSSDSLVLKSYLDNYPDAPEAHVDSIKAHLQMLRLGDKEWTDALISNSRSTFEAYLEKHPDTPHKAEIMLKLDSIDWQLASSANTLEAYQAYLSDHANGEHVDEANDGIKQIKTKIVSPTEQQMVQGVIQQFFQSINSRNAAGVTATLEATITSFLGKENATPADAIEFMNRLYKENTASMEWTTSGFKITKKEVGDEQYEYAVTFTAIQTVKHNDQQPDQVNTYKVNAKVSPDDLISTLGMTRIIE